MVNSLRAQRVELPDRRTLNSRTFRNPDNTLTTELSAGYLHYRDNDGKFQPIDNRIVPSTTEYDFEVTQGFYHVYFKNDLQSDWPVVSKPETAPTSK